MRQRDHLDPESALYRLRHSFAHVLASAVLELRPGAKLGYGPPTEHGFFYDFELDPPLSPEDFPELEKRMRRIINKDLAYQREEVPAPALIARFEAAGARYKADMARDFAAQGEQKLSVYTIGEFADMCRGNHVDSTGKLPADGFKLDSIAGAYWRGDERNPMLQRVYGLAFPDKAALKAHLERRELAKERDHRKLGQQLGLFAIAEEVGKGLVLWLPNGTAIRDELEQLAKEMEFRYGYERVATPHITKQELYQATGHLPHYADSMFPPMVADDGTFYLKPMNCPHHHMIFKAQPRSYRDLPLRLAEYGMCYRYEQSGELSGMLRVRAMAMNDAHIYCTPEQSKAEFIKVMELHRFYYDLFDLSDYWMRLSLPDLDAGGKYVGGREVWEQAQRIVTEAMEEVGIPYEAVTGEAAFYGPKIDFQVQNVVGREETASTNQLDLIMAERLDLSYVGPDNRPQRPHIIHRAPLGTHERFVAFLIEHYGGVFPSWLAPEQLRVLPVTDAHLEYARKVEGLFRDQLVRARVDASADTLGKKVRNAQTDKVPNLFVVGDKEIADGTVNWRRHGSREQTTLPLDTAHAQLMAEIRARTDWRVQK
jgi:threonyl-tRNA synthetase